MIRTLALCLALLCGSAHAAKPCFPDSPWMPINVIGKGYMEGANSQFGGAWRSVWCPTDQLDPATGTVTWVLYTHAVLDKYRTVSMTLVWEMGRMMVAAPDPLASLDASIKAREFIPPPGSIDRFNWESLLYAACKENIRLNPAQLQNVVDRCKVPTPIAVEVWRATGGTIFTATSGRLTGLTTRKATLNAKCNNTASQIVVNGTVYLPLDGGPLTEVTPCKKAAS